MTSPLEQLDEMNLGKFNPNDDAQRDTFDALVWKLIGADIQTTIGMGLIEGEEGMLIRVSTSESNVEKLRGMLDKVLFGLSVPWKLERIYTISPKALTLLLDLEDATDLTPACEELAGFMDEEFDLRIERSADGEQLSLRLVAALEPDNLLVFKDRVREAFVKAKVSTPWEVVRSAA